MTRAAYLSIVFVVACSGSAFETDTTQDQQTGGSSGEDTGGSSGESQGNLGGMSSGGNGGRPNNGHGGGGFGGALPNGGGGNTSEAGNGGSPIGGGGSTGGTGGTVAQGGGGAGGDPELQPYPAPNCSGFTAYNVPIDTCIRVTGRFEQRSPSTCNSNTPVISCNVLPNTGQCPNGGVCIAYLRAESGQTFQVTRYDLVGGNCPETCQGPP